MRKWTLACVVCVAVVWLAWAGWHAGTAPGNVPAGAPDVAEQPVEAPRASPGGADADAPSPEDVRHDLAADEARGGHTIARHVGLSDAQLRQRLSRESISAASTYPDLETAERVVGLTLRRHATRLAEWEARQGPRPNLVLPFSAPDRRPVGRVLRRGAKDPVEAHAAVVVLRWRRDGTFVLTSYPEERPRGREGR